MSEEEFAFNQLSEALQRHHAIMVLEHLTPIKTIYQFNIYLIDCDIFSVDTEVKKLKFHANEDMAIDYCLDNRNEKSQPN